MDQHNQKSLLPDFSTNGFTGQFNGLPHGNANSIMSTLHSLQMQSMGNQILPTTDLHTDLQNQFLIEQLQLSAMQSMYNSLNNGAKLDPKFAALTQPNLTLSTFNAMTGTEPSTSTNLYSSLPSTSGLQNLQQAVSQQALAASTLPNLALQSQLLLDNKLGAALNMKLQQTTIPQAQAAVEDWMKNICVDTLLDPFKDKLLSATGLQSSLASLNTPMTPMSSLALSNEAFKLTASNLLQSLEQASVIQAPRLEETFSIPESSLRETASPIDVELISDPTPSTSVAPDAVSVSESTPAPEATPAPETTDPSTSTPTSDETPPEGAKSGLDFDEAHDDVDNIFGLSLPEEPAAISMYRRPSSNDGGLSPISFTPPDSPTAELTFDDLFGLAAQTKDSAIKVKLEPLSSDSPSTSTDVTPPAPQPTPAVTASAPVAASVPVPIPTPAPAATPVTPVKELTAAQKAALKEEEELVKNFVKPKTVPVYKQKAALMSLEAREASKKEDPNYDAFEFDDDDDFMFGDKPVDEKDKKREQLEPVKKERDIIAKNVYITGVGFEVQNDKERHVRKPPKQPVTISYNDTLIDKTFFTLADKIRTERDKQLSCTFLKMAQSNSTECAKNMRRVTKEQPLLPKFIIRIDHLQTVTDEPPARKKYKRRKNRSDNDDSDFEDTPYRKRKTTRKVYSLHKSTELPFRRTVQDFPIGPCVPAADMKRVRMFGPAEGILPKGTYVVCKADILKDDCAVWRVDNQNLLQKFPPFRDAKSHKLVYKSSSTYSGWCEQISSQYFRVSVRVLKQNRSETTVEPEITLNEIFCASSIEWFKNPRTFYFKEESPEKSETGTVIDEKTRVALTTVLDACLNLVFTKNYVSTLVDKLDWTYFRSLAEIEEHNVECEALIKKRIPVEMKHNKWIGTYTRLAVSKSSYHCLSKCQICKRKKPRRVIHFFDKTSYDTHMIVDEPVEDKDVKPDGCPLVADAITCGRCSMAVEFLHKMHHLQFHMLRMCEDKLEEIGTTEIDLSTEKMIEVAKADKPWVLSVIKTYCDLWEQVRFEFRNAD